MKKLLSIALAGSILALAGCGGESSSSSYTGTKTLVNGNKYTCSSEAAMDSCKDDTTCKANCKLTYSATKPVDTNTNKTCNVDGKTVTGLASDSCRFNNNNDANVVITCDGSRMTLDGKIGSLNSQNSSLPSGSNIYGYTVQCP